MGTKMHQNVDSTYHRCSVITLDNLNMLRGGLSRYSTRYLQVNALLPDMLHVCKLELLVLSLIFVHFQELAPLAHPDQEVMPQWLWGLGFSGHAEPSVHPLRPTLKVHLCKEGVGISDKSGCGRLQERVDLADMVCTRSYPLFEQLLLPFLLSSELPHVQGDTFRCKTLTEV